MVDEKMREKELEIALDIGTDSIKVAFAYASDGENMACGKLGANTSDGAPFPMLAYYKENEQSWIFGEEVKIATKYAFKFVVKIKDLLNMLISNDGNVDNSSEYFKEREFLNFYFPPKEKTASGKRGKVSKDDIFTAKQKPCEVCELFFDFYFKNIIIPNITKLITCRGYSPTKIALTALYPLGVNTEYTEEIKRLLKKQLPLLRDSLKIVVSNEIKVISAPKAIALNEYHSGRTGVVETALVVNIGDAETSLAKINYCGSKVMVDGIDAHKKPIAIGGKDYDTIIYNLLEWKLARRSVLGAQNDEFAPKESGTYYEQFMMMNAIKSGKTLFCLPDEDYDACFGSNGVLMRVERDVSVYVSITRQEFLEGISTDNGMIVGCNDGVYAKLWKYIEEELLKASADANGILIAGGAANGFGLKNYISQKLKEFNSSRKRFVKFINADAVKNDNCNDEFDVSANENNLYSAALGAAIFAINKYTCVTKASLHYGTWVLREKSQNSYEKIFSALIALGEEIPNEGLERMEGLTISSPVIGEIKNDEFFSATVAELRGKAITVGEKGTEERKFAENWYGLKVLCTGSILFSPSAIKGFSYAEGIRIDADGRATPFAKNTDKKYPNVNVTLSGMKAFKMKYKE